MSDDPHGVPQEVAAATATTELAREIDQRGPAQAARFLSSYPTR